MKTIHKKLALVVLCLLGFTMVKAQTAIDKTTVDGSGLVDFGTANKAIILPWVQDAEALSGASKSNGTMLYDTTTRKVRAVVNGIWIDLSVNGDNTTTHNAAITASLAKTEKIPATQSGVIIGATSSAAVGVLVLESDTKALILPKMASPHLNMISPAPGTLVYDTVKNLMCVFDGKEWSFWGI